MTTNPMTTGAGPRMAHVAVHSIAPSPTTPRRMTPGDDMHLTLLMTPHGLNFVTGQDRQHLLAFGRAAFEAGKATAAAQQGVQQAYVLEDDGQETYLDGCESRFSICRAGGECVAWVAPLDEDSGEAVAREMIAALNAAHPTTQGLDARDAAFEAVRKAFCKLQRYSFLLDSRGNVRRCADHCGSWVEFDAVHTLFEPQSVDAAIAAQAKEHTA